MSFIAQGPEGEQAPYGVNKTNIKYILIVIILSVIVGGGILGAQHWFFPEKSMPNLSLPTPVKKLKTSEYPFTIPYRAGDPVERQVFITVNSLDPLTDDFRFTLINPDGRIVEPPVVYDYKADIYNLFEKQGKSWRIQEETITYCKLMVGDPLAEPIKGDWKLLLVAPEGIELVIGVTAL